MIFGTFNPISVYHEDQAHVHELTATSNDGGCQDLTVSRRNNSRSDARTMYRCAQVCRLWSNEALDLLYRDISLEELGVMVKKAVSCFSVSLTMCPILRCMLMD